MIRTPDPKIPNEIIRSPAARDALIAMLTAGLTRPASLTRASVEVLRQGPPLDRGGDDTCALWLGVVAALLYARPDLVDDALLDRVADIAKAESLPESVGPQVVKLFAFLASDRWASQAWRLLSGILLDERTGPGARERLVPLVRDFVQWTGDLIGLDGVLTLSESAALASHRPFLLDYGVEPFVFSSPESFTVDLLERAATLFVDAPRYRYFLYALACRRGASPQVRAWVDRRLVRRLPHQEIAAAVLKATPMNLLVVHNIAMGQGDDIVRLVPLLQALLDANLGLSITIITHRTYLYDNPRVTSVSITNDASIQTALAGPIDGVVELLQPDRPELAFRSDLDALVERVLLERRPPFIVKAELGRAQVGDRGIRSEFVYQTVELAGRDIAESRGLDRRGLRSIYEPCMRLQAELGLPQRAAEEPPASPALLTGVRSADAERVWRGFVRGDDARKRRPVALVNPFGGSRPTKGFLNQPGLLADELSGLVDEGYLVILVANATAWVTGTAIDDVLSRLTPGVRAFIRLAPDPAEGDEAARLDLSERPELVYADRVMRLFKYFVTYADLVATVEGWMAHLAYCQGRPFRLFLAAGSFPFDWYPYGRGPNQRVVATLSPRSRGSHSASALVGDSHSPPFPHQPRKSLLELGLAGLGQSGRLEAVSLLRRAAASPDDEVRTWAIAALGRISPADATKAHLLATLQEREPTVARAAAEALLRGDVDCSRELGPRYREQLNLYVDIARHDWEAVGRVGPAALPALFRAATSENYLVRRETRAMLRRMLASYVRELPPAFRVAAVMRPSQDMPYWRADTQLPGSTRIG